MRVLFITHYADLYGANLSLLGLILSLRKNFGVEPVVLINRKGDFIKELQKNNIPYIKSFYFIDQIEENQPHKIIHIIYRKMCIPFLYFIAGWKLKAKRCSFDLVHTNSSVISIGAYIAKINHIPHVWHLREFGKEDYNLQNMYSTCTIRKRLSQSDRVIAISKAIYEKFVSEYGKLPIEVIPNGVPICERYVKCEINKCISFVVVGLICDGKNQLEVLKAINIIKAKGYETFKVFFFGDYKDEGYKREFFKYIEDNRLKEIVHIMGYEAEVQEKLKQYHVGIVPSKKEAFGRVTIEFMSHYMPVIGSNSGANQEIIKEDETGLLYELGDVEGLANKMIYCINNRQEVQCMGRQARLEAEQYSVEENARKIKSIYDSIMETRRKG